mmetsp:Transcript_31783/g.95153  ORF Transcript_31783/g.95153 Transcript_31783/m.95153 type:complete len:99 (-) Transcript_31783:36-332(-)
MMCFPPPHTGAESCICKGDPQIGLASRRMTCCLVLLNPVQIKGKVGGDHEEHGNSHGIECFDHSESSSSWRRGRNTQNCKERKEERRTHSAAALLNFQ